MISRSHLFDKGPLTRDAGLSDLLEARKRKVITKIKGITNLDQMTDSFCDQLIKDAFVDPPVMYFDLMKRQTRIEEIDAAYFPGDFSVTRGRRYPKTIVRISIPFSGDQTLLSYTPSTACLAFPQGEVTGNTIQFDVILWGYQDDAVRVKQELEANREQLEFYATKANKDVKQFNESLAAQIKSAFSTKLAELTKQHAIFDDLGIPEEPDTPTPAMSNNSVSPKATKGGGRAQQIIMHVETMLVQTLNQTNQNTGDVNNAIQSN